LLRPRHEVVVVLHGHDVVGHGYEPRSVALRDFLDLGLKTRGALVPIRHAVGIEATEGAMRFGAPPAAARRFEREDEIAIFVQTKTFTLREEIVVVGYRQRVHVLDRRRRFAAHDAIGLTPERTRQSRRSLAAREACAELRKAVIDLAAE